MKLIALFLFILFGFTYAQIPMQSWRIHFSAFEAVNAVESNNIISMAAENGIVQYDLISNEINTFTVTDGLSDKKISAIEVKGDVLIVGYENGNIDLVENNQITNIPWLKRALISGNKAIQNILIDKDKAYLCSGAGVIVFDITKKEISDTYVPYDGAQINDIAIFKDSFLLATNEGIYAASTNSPFLNNKDNWNLKSGLPDYINSGKITQMELFNGHLFFALDFEAFNGDSLFKIDGNDNLDHFFSESTTIRRLSVSNNHLVISRFSNTLVFDSEFKEVKNIFDYAEGPPPSPRGAVYMDDTKELWIADGNNGLVRAIDPFGNNKQVYDNSPLLDGCYKIDIQKGKVAVAGGGLTGNLQKINAIRGVYLFEDEQWNNISKKTHPVELVDSLNSDIIGIAVNPKNTDQVAFSSYSRGGLKILNGTEITQQFNQYNSPLEEQLGNNEVMIISDLQYDKDGNLWMVNAGVNPLKMLDKDGKWHTYSLGAPSNHNFPLRLLIDSRGYKWIAMNGVGVVAFDDNGTFDDLSDDRTVTITDSEGFGSLPSKEVKTIAEDIDGEIWLGTANGIAVFYSVGSIFDGGYGDADASQIVVFDDEKEDFVPIFDKVTVSSIAIDGGNRKWIGTSASGVFCMSPNGKNEIFQFGTENSPLVSNSIVDIKMDYESGEVYFATEEGLISYRADITSGDNSFSNVIVYPNPVRPEYTGVITIEGVGYESYVRVTDISGNLIYQTISNGGTILWDGKRLTGERVQSGVYLVWSAKEEGKGDNVAKILILN